MSDLSSLMLEALVSGETSRDNIIPEAEQKKYLLLYTNQLALDDKKALGRLAKVRQDQLDQTFVHQTADGVVIDLDCVSKICPELLCNMYRLVEYKIETTAKAQS